MKKKVIKFILSSGEMDARTKWFLVKYIKSHEISEEKLKEITTHLSSKEEIEKIINTNEEEIYLKKLKEWNEKAEKLIHELVPKEIKKAEEESRKQDEIEEEKLLAELENMA